MIYYAVYGSMMLLALLTLGKPVPRRNIYYMCLFFLILFVAYRYDVGCDFRAYEEHFLLYGNDSIADALARSESGYWLLIILLNELGFTYFSLNLVTAIVFFGGMHVLASRQPDPLGYLVLSFPVLVTGIAMSATRQALACGILCVALAAFNNRRPFSYIGLVVLASLFHRSGLAFIALAPFILFRVDDPRSIAAAAMAIAVIGYFLSGDSLTQYTELYIGTEHDAVGGPFRVGFVMLTGVMFFLLMRTRWQARFPVDYNLTFIASLAMVGNFGLVFVSSVMGDRIGYYLMLVQLIIFSKAYLLFETKDIMLVYLTPYIIAGMMLVGWSQLSWIFVLCYQDYRLWLD